MTFEKVEPWYTGGNIYVFYGKLTDGRYFSAESSMFDIRFLNEDPLQPSDDPEYYEYVADDMDWQQDHLVEDWGGDTKTLDFWKDMLNFCLKTSPEGNYNDGDLKNLLAEVEELYSHENWR